MEDSVRVVDRTFDILEAIAEEEGTIGLSELVSLHINQLDIITEAKPFLNDLMRTVELDTHITDEKLEFVIKEVKKTARFIPRGFLFCDIMSNIRDMYITCKRRGNCCMDSRSHFTIGIKYGYN